MRVPQQSYAGIGGNEAHNRCQDDQARVMAAQEKIYD
jgi:hypothetical protein